MTSHASSRVATLAAAGVSRPGAVRANNTLTAVPGIKVGHFTLAERPTGCTVILAEAGATAGVDVRGAAPAHARNRPARPGNIVQIVHAIVLSGGSAFGLDAAGGVMRYLEEKQHRLRVRTHRTCRSCRRRRCSTWPSATEPIRPTADCGYQAARMASTAPVAGRQRRRRRRRHGRQSRRHRARDEGRHRQRAPSRCRTA